MWKIGTVIPVVIILIIAAFRAGMSYSGRSGSQAHEMTQVMACGIWDADY